MTIRGLIDRLLLLPGFPKEERAHLALSEELTDILTDLPDPSGSSRQLGSIAESMRDCEKWPGLGPFLKMARKIVHPPPEQQEYDPAWKHEDRGPICKECQNSGYVDADADHHVKRCEACINGKEYPQNLIEMENARIDRIKQGVKGRPRGGLTPVSIEDVSGVLQPQPFTQADIDRAKDLRQLQRGLETLAAEYDEKEPKE
jgi:hypothetical protein